MKRLISLVMFVMMLIPVFTVYGSEEDRVMMIVSCLEQNFSTVCRPECSYEFSPEGGLTIWLDEGYDAGRISIFKTDAPGADFDAEAYFNNAFLNLLETSYGDNLIDPGSYTLYPFGGREMPGRLALYLRNGEPWMRFCLYDLQDDYFVRYEAFSFFDDATMQSAIDDLSDAVRYFQPDALFYSGGTEEETSAPEPEQVTEKEPENVPATTRDEDTEDGVEVFYPPMPEEAEAGPNYKIISCTAQGFSTKCGYYDTVEFKSHLGVTAFLDTDGAIVWVRVNRMTFDPDFDAAAYFQETINPSMQTIYRDNAYADEPFTTFTVDGKSMPGQEYHFSISGYDYTRRIMFYQTGDELVRFEAQYTEDTNRSVMYDLERVVKNYQPDPMYYLDSSPSDADIKNTGGVSEHGADPDTGAGSDIGFGTDTGAGSDTLELGTETSERQFFRTKIH